MFFKKTLQKEAKKWVQKNYISQQQAQNIISSYADSKSYSFSVVTILGYFFLGLSLLVLIGHNWENIPVFIRASGLIALTFFVQIFAFLKFSKEKKTNAFFLGNFIYGVSIFLIAQAYHLGTYSANGVFWWALGSFFIALLIQNSWVSLQAFVLSLLWYFMEIGNFYPFLFWLFLIFAMIIFYKDKTQKALFILFLPSFSLFYLYTLARFLYDGALGWSKNHQATANTLYIDNFSFVFFLLPTFTYFALLFGIWLQKNSNEKWKDYGEITYKISLFTLYFISFFLLIRANTEKMLGLFAHYDKFSFFEIWAILFVPILILNFILKIRIFYIITFLHVMLFGLCFFIKPQESLYFFVFINISIFCIYGFLIYKGILQSSFLNYFFGVLGLLAFAFIRYVALIEDYVGASLLFFICAIILLIASKTYGKLQKNTSNLA